MDIIDIEIDKFIVKKCDELLNVLSDKKDLNFLIELKQKSKKNIDLFNIKNYTINDFDNIELAKYNRFRTRILKKSFKIDYHYFIKRINVTQLNSFNMYVHLLRCKKNLFTKSEKTEFFESGLASEFLETIKFSIIKEFKKNLEDDNN